MAQTGMQRLAEAVRTRRTQLGLAQGSLASRGGPSVVTVGQIERGQAENVQPLTLAGLDTALAWPAGTAASILYGIPIPAAAAATHPDVDGNAIDQALAALEQAAQALRSLRNGT